MRQLVARARGLSNLRSLVPLAPSADLSEVQWSAIEADLAATSGRIMRPLLEVSREHLALADDSVVAARMTRVFGQTELALSTAYASFDTWMDILSQRLSPTLGPLLKGCDALAQDGLRRGHPAVDAIAPPVVYCDRGFGASVLREGMRMPGGGRSPMPLVQIPYARLHQKLNLTSLLHEVGHEAYIRLHIDAAVVAAFEARLARAGVAREVIEIFVGWRNEIFCDFWAFGSTGFAHAATMFEVLALEPDIVTRVAFGEKHPTPYLRVLLGIEWCRTSFGRGRWDVWREQFLRNYDSPSRPQSELLRACIRALPVVASLFFDHRFARLSQAPLTALFDIDRLSPARMRELLRGKSTRSPEFLSMRPCEQLAAFRLLSEYSTNTEESIARCMTEWLHHLARPSSRARAGASALETLPVGTALTGRIREETSWLSRLSN